MNNLLTCYFFERSDVSGKKLASYEFKLIGGLVLGKQLNLRFRRGNDCQRSGIDELQIKHLLDLRKQTYSF